MCVSWPERLSSESSSSSSSSSSTSSSSSSSSSAESSDSLLLGSSCSVPLWWNRSTRDCTRCFWDRPLQASNALGVLLLRVWLGVGEAPAGLLRPPVLRLTGRSERGLVVRARGASCVLWMTPLAWARPSRPWGNDREEEDTADADADADGGLVLPDASELGLTERTEEDGDDEVEDDSAPVLLFILNDCCCFFNGRGKVWSWDEKDCTREREREKQRKVDITSDYYYQILDTTV